VAALDAHRAHLEGSGEFARQCARRCEAQFLTLAHAAVLAQLHERAGAALLEEVRSRRLDPYSAAERLLAPLRSGGCK
jgi:LAO/AO transport system kinase